MSFQLASSTVCGCMSKGVKSDPFEGPWPRVSDLFVGVHQDVRYLLWLFVSGVTVCPCMFVNSVWSLVCLWLCVPGCHLFSFDLACEASEVF